MQSQGAIDLELDEVFSTASARALTAAHEILSEFACGKKPSRTSRLELNETARTETTSSVKLTRRSTVRSRFLGSQRRPTDTNEEQAPCLIRRTKNA